MIEGQKNIQPLVAEVITDIKGMEPEARVIVSKLEKGKKPTAQNIADLYPDIEELIGDLQQLVPAAQKSIDGVESK